MPDKWAVQIIFMPDAEGKMVPAPFVLTEEDLSRFLRLENVNPSRAIRRYREKGTLRATQVGKKMRYLLPDVLMFLEKQNEVNPR